MERKGNKLIGLFDGQIEVLDKINELKSQGHSEDDMYLIAKRGEQLAMFRDYTKAHLSTEEGGDWMDNFKSLFSGEASLKNAFNHMGFEPNDSDAYYQQVESGKILLYVDSGSESSGDRRPSSETDIHINDARPSSETDVQINDKRLSSEKAIQINDENTEEHLRLHEERLNIDKERVQTGEVNVGKHIIEEEKNIEVPVEREEVVIERRPVNLEVTEETSGTAVRKEVYQVDGNIHIPLVEEQIVVTKKEVVKEEIVITKRKIRDVEHIKETVRREAADIDDQTKQ